MLFPTKYFVNVLILYNRTKCPLPFFFQLENLPQDEIPSDELKEGITPYIFESGLNIDMSSDRKILIQGVMIYFVIHKRKEEMDDIAQSTLNFLPLPWLFIMTCIALLD